MRHKILSKNIETLTGVCAVCGECRLKKKKKGKLYSCYNSEKRWLTYHYTKKSRYTKHKKTMCEKCGFVALHPCQLDVHHLDENHKNNNVENLQTLCANCHRLETQTLRDENKKKTL